VARFLLIAAIACCDLEVLMSAALLTDLYEITMASSYLRRGMDKTATFSLFVRDLPPTRGFLVAAGLEQCLAYLEGLRFEEQDLTYLRSLPGFDAEAVRALSGLTFTGDVWAVPEGRIVFANEPLLEVTAPIAEAQLVETYLLNQITLHTTLASKAARCRIAAQGRDLVDFSMRRTHGVDAAFAVARATALVGFVATSNVEAARLLGLPPSGTMAHSYIEAFPDEIEAFNAFAEDWPGRATFLVDTYDTLRGVHAAIAVIKRQGLSGPLAIRLDSGDLALLAHAARLLLDEAGLTSVRIVASGALDELAIDDLLTGGAPIDAFGVGTRIGVSADAPYLDTVYKLVIYDGRPVLKLSAGKRTAPGAKQIFRQPGMAGDILALRQEAAPAGYEPLLAPVMLGGRRIDTAPGLQAARQRFETDLAALPASVRDLRQPRPLPVTFSAALRALGEEVSAAIERQPGTDEVQNPSGQ
jgi:nicotinate phosphoribosyltransferase